MALSRIVMDTSAYSAMKRGHPELVSELRRTAEVLVSSISLGELLSGFARGTREKRNRAELEAFLRSPRVAVTAIGRDTAERYAAVYRSLRQAGRPIPTNDMWIAASAMEHGAELWTLDGDFLHVPQILVRRFDT